MTDSNGVWTVQSQSNFVDDGAPSSLVSSPVNLLWCTATYARTLLSFLLLVKVCNIAHLPFLILAKGSKVPFTRNCRMKGAGTYAKVKQMMIIVS